MGDRKVVTQRFQRSKDHPDDDRLACSRARADDANASGRCHEHRLALGVGEKVAYPCSTLAMASRMSFPSERWQLATDPSEINRATSSSMNLHALQHISGRRYDAAVRQRDVDGP